MVVELIFLLLPVAAFSGWIVGRRQIHERARSQKTLSREYYAGLNYLLNEETDKALEVFIKILEISPDCTETTLALGHFFRKRGEVARAIHIHQTLVDNPNISAKERTQSRMALAEDYLCAGMYDRAEQLLMALSQNPQAPLEKSLRGLIDIYEREKEWQKAIECAERLHQQTGQSMAKCIAHYYCELAENAWSKGQIRHAFKSLKKGLVYDPDCARANISWGFFEKKMGHPRRALQRFLRVQQQDPCFLPEVLPLILDCYETLGWQQQSEDYLNALMMDSPKTCVVLAKARLIEATEGQQRASQFLTTHMHKHPSIRGIKQLIEFHLERVVGEVRNELLILKSHIEQLINNKPIYRCWQCGFASRMLNWQCPSCRQWAELRPIQGIEGE